MSRTAYNSHGMKINEVSIFTDSFYSALPEGIAAPYKLKLFRSVLIKNIVGYLEAVEKQLPQLHISPLIEKYANIDSDRNFSPSIYTYFTKLVDACRSKDISNIVTAVHYLNILTEDDIYDATLSISTILTEYWENDYVNLIRQFHIPKAGVERTLVLPILNPAFKDVVQTVYEVLDLIKEADTDFYKEFETLVTRIKIFNGKGLSGSSSASVFGVIYTNLPPKNENSIVHFAEHIIHEASHLSLEVLHGFDTLITNNPSDTYKSPIRTDPRPMIGVFHATFVLARLIRLFKRLKQQSGSNIYDEKLEKFIFQFDEGFDTISKHALFTLNGRNIFDSLQITVES
jgi:hypothetical protein